MERIQQLNRIELIGLIGNIRTSEVGGRKIARMTVATNLCYKTTDGTVCIETTWTPVTAFEGKKVNLDGLEKSTPVHIIGRLRNQRYTAADGTENSSFEVLASTVEKIEEEGVQCETIE